MEFEGTLDGQNVLLWIDNSAVVSWLKRSSRSDDFAFWMFRVLGGVLLRNDFSLWGQNLAGDLIFFADALSRKLSCSFDDLIRDVITKFETHNFSLPSLTFIKSLHSQLQQWISTVLECVMYREELTEGIINPKSLTGEMDRILSVHQHQVPRPAKAINHRSISHRYFLRRSIKKN